MTNTLDSEEKVSINMRVISSLI